MTFSEGYALLLFGAQILFEGHTWSLVAFTLLVLGVWKAANLAADLFWLVRNVITCGVWTTARD